jgi:hypothetical protein
MVRAALAGNFTNFPGLTAKLIRKHYVKTAATAMGHLARTRANLRSTKPPLDPPSPPGLKPPNIVRAIFHPTETNYSDGTGNVLDLNFFFLVLYHFDKNYIHAEIVRDHTSASYIAAYNRGLDTLATDGIFPTHEVMDNVLSQEIAANLESRRIQIHLVPVDDHRTNKAERAIRTFKDHWIANMASVSRTFPISGVKHLLPQVLISLNLLRQSRTNPSLSAWAGVHGPYDFNAHPMHPPGTRCVVLDDPSKRQSFANHGTQCYYVGPALRHYRVLTVYNPITRSTRYSNSVEFLPDVPDIPRYATLPPQILPTAVLPPTDHDALPIGAPIYDVIGDPDQADHPTFQPYLPPTPNLFQLLKDDIQQLAIHPASVAPDDPTIQPRHSARTNRAIPPAHLRDNYLLLAATTHAPAETEGGGPPRRRHHVHRRPTASHTLKSEGANPAPAASAPVTPPTSAVHPDTPWDQLKHMQTRTESFNKSRKGIHATLVEDGFIDEIDRLTTRTQSIALLASLPPGAFAPHGNPTVKFSLKSADGIQAPITTCRVRLTSDGSRSRYTGDRSSTTTNLFTVKCLLNSAVSDDDSDLCAVDIKDAYLTAKLDTPEYMTIPLSYFPERCRTRFSLDQHPAGTMTYWRIDKALYGMPQAGLLFQNDLTQHLAAHGYRRSKTTECLYIHDTLNISFLVWVDDFLIKFKRSDRAAIDHLLAALRSKYEITVDWTASSYVGLDICRDRLARTITISMDGYIERLQEELKLILRKDPKNPLTYLATKYTSDPQMEEVDDSPPASTDQIKFLQIIVGKLLFYSIAIDLTIAVAVNRLSMLRSKATQKTVAMAMRLIQYILHHPNAHITYRPSDMQLMCHSDASHDSEPGSRSRIAGAYIFGSTDFEGSDVPKLINGCVGFMSKQAPTVCAGAYESEYAALWGNVCFLEAARQTCADLGHPQNSTVIVYDNTVAGAIAIQACKQKRSKMVAKQYHWIQERTATGDYTLVWRKGIHNLADFLTKAHPTHHFEAMRQFFVSYPVAT